MLTHSPAPRRRSGWLLRILFGFVFLLLAVEILTIAWLVGGTVLKVASGDTGTAPPAEQSTRYITAGQSPPQTTPDGVADETNVWDEHGPINILLLGLDADDCALPSGSPQRTDTMILVRIDPQTKKAAMLSIPRDLYVYIDGYGAKKINTAHVLGAASDMDDAAAGPELLRQVVQENLELPVHRYVRIDFEGFLKLIDDGLGGLTMDLPPSEYDPTVSLYDEQYPDGHCGTMTIQFEPGEHELTGEEALQYARSRKSTSDFDRSRRQMEVLMAIREAGTSASIIPRVPKLISALRDTIDTDLSNKEVLSLARIARGMSTEDIITLRIDENAVYDDMLVIDSVQQWVLVHRQDKLDDLRRQFLNMEEPQEATASNGTPVTTPQP
jgi:LCP family protein required for cell wall assembly